MSDSTFGQNLLSLAIIVAFASLGGFLVALFQGITLPGGRKTKPLCTAITVPPLVGMIIFGCIARNFFGDITLEHFPVEWADWIRQICLCIILMRGGLELEFEGIGLTVVLLSLCPQIVEASAVAVLSRWLFDLPWTLCFANGFCIGAVSPAVILNSILVLIEQKRGTKKGIPYIMLAASSFDDIIAITVFTILVSIWLEEIQESGGKQLSVKNMIGMNVFYIVAGVAFGGLLGYIMSLFNKCKSCSHYAMNWMKFLVTLAIAMITPYVCYVTHFEESKYIGIIFFGYICYQVWGSENKPDKYLATFWTICQPFLFGSIGASIEFSQIGASVVGKALLILALGLIFRWLATYGALGGGKYDHKERSFVAFAWFPKATVQAALGGMVYDAAYVLKGVPEAERAQYLDYGTILLTNAVIAIVVTAPLGAILINTLGNKWLPNDAEEEVTAPGDKVKEEAPAIPVTKVAAAEVKPQSSAAESKPQSDIELN